MIYTDTASEVAQNVAKDLTVPPPQPPVAAPTQPSMGHFALDQFQQPNYPVPQSGPSLSDLVNQYHGPVTPGMQQELDTIGRLSQLAPRLAQGPAPLAAAVMRQNHPYDINVPAPSGLMQYGTAPRGDEFTLGNLANVVNAPFHAIGASGQAALNNASLTGGLLGEQVGIPNVTLGDIAQKIPGGQTALNFAGQSAPFVAADVLTGGALTPAYLAQAGVQGAAIGDAYRTGKLSGEDALKQLALSVGPVAVPLALRGAGAGVAALRDFANSERGQAVLTRLAEERASVGQPPPGEGGRPPEPPQEPPAEARAGEAGAPAPAQSPPSPEPLSGEIMPPENQKLIGLMGQTVISPIDRAAALKEARSLRAGAAAGILSGEGAPQDLLAQAGATRAGKILPEAKPIVQEFTPEELTSYKQQIVDSFRSGQVSPFDATRAGDALDTLLLGRRQLQPAEVKLLGRIFGPEFEAAIPTTQKQFSLWQNVVDAANLPRTLIASADLSAPFRQGILLGPGHPGEFAASFGDMLKAALSDKNAASVDSGIQRLGSYDMAIEAGLDHVKQYGTAEVMKEESFMSRLAEQIPVLGPLVKASERAYVTFLNDLRFRVFDNVVRGWKEGTYNQGDLQNLAHYLNNATGRGSLGALQQYGPALNALFFSPRFLASRFELAADLLRPTQSSAVRLQAMRDLGAFVTTGVGVLSLAKLSGAKVQLDPRSSDFGKVNGVDFWGGYQQIARYAAQAITRSQVVSGVNGENVTMPRDFTKVFSNFLRSKLAPIPSSVVSLHVGRDFAGNKYTPAQLMKLSPSNPLIQMVAPLAWQDLVQSIQAQGLQGAATGALSTFGFGVTPQTGNPQLQQRATTYAAKQSLNSTGILNIADQAFSNPKWTDALTKQIGLDASQYKTLADYKAAYVAQATPLIAQRDGITAAEAKLKAQSIFDKFSMVKQLGTQEQQQRHAYWKAHPDQLEKMVEAQAYMPRDDFERKILADYRKANPAINASAFPVTQ